MIATQRSSIGRIVSAFSDGRLTETRLTPVLVALDQVGVLRLTADRDVEPIRIAAGLGRHLTKARNELRQRRRDPSVICGIQPSP